MINNRQIKKIAFKIKKYISIKISKKGKVYSLFGFPVHREKICTNIPHSLFPSYISDTLNDFWMAFSSLNIIVDDVVRKRTVNIFIPVLRPALPAGPLSILYFAKFIYNLGINVRLLVYPNISPIEKLRNYIGGQEEGLYDLSKNIEIECLDFNKYNSITINSQDMTVATYFNSAYHAKQIQENCEDKNFIYFIQDDERIFFSGGSMHALVENTYGLRYYPIFSTEVLKQAFLQENIGNIRKHESWCISQKSPSSYYLPPKEMFLRNSNKRRFVFYARPSQSRNCYEYCLFIIIKALKMNILSDDWSLFGIGFGSCKGNIQITNDKYIELLPNMPLVEYKKLLPTFDVALCLMESPHYSMPPVDLALSGCVVVTNIYKTKTKEDLSNVSKNIIGVPLELDSMLSAIKIAIEKSMDVEARYKNAIESNYPGGNEIFTADHKKWIFDIFNGRFVND